MSKLEPYYENPEFGVTLFWGDCLEIMPTLAPGSVDMVAADLPYGTTACKWDTVIPFEPLWACYKRVTKPNAAIVLTASQPFTSALVMSNPKMFRHEWTWIKNAGSNFANTVREPMKEHESALVFSNGGWTYNKQMQNRTGAGLSLIGKRVGTGAKSSDNYREGLTGPGYESLPEMRVPSSWQKFNRERGYHPTQKPVALMEYLIRTYTNEGDTVLDNTFGSGTTAVACVNTRRKFVGMELDADGKDYCGTAVDRIEKAIAERAKLRQLEIAV